MRKKVNGVTYMRYADKMKNVKKSAIRSVMADASENGTVDYISFASGFPDPDAIPQEKLEEVGHKILQEKTYEVLQYGSAQGYTGLIESSKSFINKHECICTSDDDIIITTGSQQGLDLVSKIFCDEGDYVVVENPSYLGALNSFKCNGAKLLGVSLEEDGVNLEELEEAFKKGPKVFYTIPNFQNPTGVTTSLEKRKEIYNLAVKYDVVIHVYTRDAVYAYNLTEDEKRYVQNRQEMIEVFDQNLDFLKGQEIVKILYTNTDFEYLQSIDRDLKDITYDMDVSYSSNRYIEFNHKGVNKGAGLKKLANLLHIDIQDTIAIGDNYNDLSMIKDAGLGVGVQNLSLIHISEPTRH